MASLVVWPQAVGLDACEGYDLVCLRASLPDDVTGSGCPMNEALFLLASAVIF